MRARAPKDSPHERWGDAALPLVRRCTLHDRWRDSHTRAERAQDVFRGGGLVPSQKMRDEGGDGEGEKRKSTKQIGIKKRFLRCMCVAVKGREGSTAAAHEGTDARGGWGRTANKIDPHPILSLPAAAAHAHRKAKQLLGGRKRKE